MAFTLNITDTTAVDSSIVLAYDQSFIVATGQNQVLEQFAEWKVDIGAKSISLPKFSRLGLATTPLTETDDVTSSALSDVEILLTPKEYGQVVTTSSLAALQTGGKANLAAATLVGINAGQTQDKLAMLALDASTNQYIIGGTAEGSVTAGQVASGVFLNTMYNKLARASVPMINGAYVMIAHDDVIADLRADATVGSWQDVVKYALPGEALINEVGMYKGFRVIRQNNATFADQTGAGLVDIYNSYFLGANGLGKATSHEIEMRMTGPFDKLGRFANLGWYGVFEYKIIDSDAVWVGRTASSVGVNA